MNLILINFFGSFNAFSHAICGFQDIHCSSSDHGRQGHNERSICQRRLGLWLEMQEIEGVFGLQLQSMIKGV